MNLMSLFILIFIIGLLLIPVSRIKGYFITWQGSLVLTGVYLAALLVLIPLLYLLPDQGMIKDSPNIDQAAWQVTLEELYNLPAQIDLHEPDGLYKTGSMTFKFGGDKLEFKVAENAGGSIVMVERKDVDDGKIEISTYTTPYRIDDIDFTELVFPLDISLENNILTVGMENQRLEFSVFKGDFVTDQFKGNKMFTTPRGINYGWQIVYVHIPKSLATEGESWNLKFVNKE